MTADELQEVLAAWNTAYNAADRVCTTLASVGGSAGEYNALCKLATRWQRDGANIMERLRGKARRA